MYGCGKSDSSIVPKKSANKGDPAGFGTTAERMEGRGLAKGNVREQNRSRTQNRERLQSELGRIRQIAAMDKRCEVHCALASRLQHRPSPQGVTIGIKRNSAQRSRW